MSVSPSAFGSSARLGLCLFALAGASRAAESPSWTVVRGKVQIVCPMTVGGGFEATSPTLFGTLALAGVRPTVLAGDLVVDLRTLDTGIGLRDEHLRSEYLEVGKGDGFDKAVLSGLSLGDVDPETFQGRATFTGNLTLHGMKVAVKGQAEIRREGAGLRVEANFPVRIADHGIAKPQYLGIGVRNEVHVKVSLVLRSSAAPPAEGGR
jgi:polyisoprenoid-binding protein YceI